jgi:drug/metabolite transporter (DMT)-like permease
MKLRSATLLIILATLAWGGTPAIMKLTLKEVPPFSLAFIRMFVASLILGVIIFKRIKIQKADIPQFILAAIFGVTLNIGFFFIGLKLAPAINAALLIASVPIFTLICAGIFLREKMHTRVIVASILAIIGVVVIIGKPDSTTTIYTIIGNILLLLSSLAWVGNEIVSKKLLRKYSGSIVAFYTMAIGALTFAPFALYEYAASPNWISEVTLSGLLGILYGVFVASLFAYWAWQTGLAKLSADQASFYFYLDPISGAILAIVLLGEKITPSLIFGGALIAVAVILAELKRKPHPLYRK